MNLTNAKAQEILAIHDTLWNALYGDQTTLHTLLYNDVNYDIKIPGHRGYASILLPNSNGIKFLWITQNLNKTTYGTMAIERHRSLNNDHRITWIVDTNNGGFSYRSNITTTRNSAGQLLHGAIQIYDSLGQETIWSNNQSIVTRKAEF